MKKKTIYLVALIFISWTYPACNKKDLDLPPLADTELEYFTEELHFEKAIIGVYAKLNDVYWFNGNFPIHGVWLLPGDDVTTKQNNVPHEVFVGLNSSNGDLSKFYTALYQMINRANTFLEKNEAENGVYVTANLKSYHRGEALFLRGYANFMLWNFFGTSPVITKRISSQAEITPPSSTGNQLLDQAISDFDAAASLLPLSWTDINKGRVTKSSANGFLGKALVFRGTVTKSKSDYSNALLAFNKVTDKALMPNFKENFNADKENNAESLFEHQANQNAGFDNVWLSDDFNNSEGSISAYWGFFNDGPGWFGKPIYSATSKLYNAFDPTDPRRDLTVKANLGDSDPANDYQIQKYVTQNKFGNSGTGSLNNPRILRYADVLLLQAEATLQSDGSKAAAIGFINQVRARARTSAPGATGPADRPTTETNTTTIMDWIRNERFIELAGEEGHRWMDLRRWHLGEQINLATWDFSSSQPAGQLVFVAPRNLNMPIPNSEIDRNPNVKQNTGY